MSLLRKLGISIIVAAITLGVYACKEEGPAERAGKQIDKAFENVKKKVDDATK